MTSPAAMLDLAEALRRLANIVRSGTVAEVDPDAARARVEYGRDPDGKPALTGWLPWLAAAAGEDRSWRPPSIGEQVLLLSPYGELSAGWILPGAYLDGFGAPDSSTAKHLTAYRDGAIVSYDAEAHELSAVLPAGATARISADGGIELDGDVTVNGALRVEGDATAAGDIGADGAVSAGRSVSAAAEVSDSGGSMAEMRGVYNVHTHGVPPAPTVPPPNQRMA